MKDGVNLFKKEDQKYNLISYTNEEELTLKEVLLDKLNFSVRSISKMKREQSVFVNGVFKKPSTKLKKGDLIEVKIEEEMANFEPQNLNLNILYDDFDIIMVNKPPFMVVHPTKSHFDNTIANGITYYIKEKNEKVKVRFVNRLDMNTSGLVIVAKNAYAHHTLSVDMGNDAVEKKYITVVKGIIENDEGTINEPIYRPTEDSIKRIVDEKGQASITTDGRHVELAGNIGSPNDVEGLIKNDAEGVGLYRTEFLYMDKEDSFPTEEEQYEAYKAVLEGMNNKPIVIRTLDIGGDKELPYFEMEAEMNPFLGYRAIRLCLDRKDIFKTQLRALYRASVHGKLRIMFPMISSLEELLDAKEVIKEVLKELDAENIAYSNDVEIGMMIEIPSAAVISDVLAKHVDFFSIGTNDLIQYTCAVDRMNQKISHLYNQFNPAVLRLIKMVIDNAHKEGKWVGMCGESAGDQRMIPILLGFGLDEFSMSPISILPARKLITSLSYADMQKFADEVLAMGTAKEIKEYVDKTFNM